MKRSEINAALRWAENLLNESCIRLPRFAYWDMETWKANKDNIDTLRTVMQGWDITDFGSGDFEKIGAVLFTVRNGSLTAPGVGAPYAEKYMLILDGQRLPVHYTRILSSYGSTSSNRISPVSASLATVPSGTSR